MSAEAVGWVYRHSPYKGATFAVHLAIADSVNDQHGNEFWMLETRLAKKSRTSRASASRAVSTLVDDGWLIRLSGPVKAGTPARFSFAFRDAPVAYDTRLTTRRVDGTRASPGDDTRLTTTQHAPHGDAHIPKEPKRNPKNSITDSSVSDSVPFDAFWKLYPRKTDKGHARVAYVKALKLTTAEEILSALERQIPAMRKADPKFVPHAATWLNGERWTDETPTAVQKHWSEELAESLS